MQLRRSNRFRAKMDGGALVSIDTTRAPVEGDLVAVLGQNGELSKPVGFSLRVDENDIRGCIELVGVPVHDKVGE